MTNREFYTAIATGTINEDVTKFAIDSIAKLDERNAKRSSKPSKTAVANEPIKAAIVELLTNAGVTKTSPDIAVAISTEENPVSTQKASALCRQLVDSGILVSSENKVPKKGKMKFYGIAPTVEVVEDEGNVDEEEITEDIAE